MKDNGSHSIPTRNHAWRDSSSLCCLFVLGSLCCWQARRLWVATGHRLFPTYAEACSSSWAPFNFSTVRCFVSGAGGCRVVYGPPGLSRHRPTRRFNQKQSTQRSTRQRRSTSMLAGGGVRGSHTGSLLACLPGTSAFGSSSRVLT